jgi:phosphoribosylformylglycinamidine (FGAM) synthase PurS component
MYEIEILTKKGFKDPRGERVFSEISGLGVKGAEKVVYSQIYRIKGEITKAEAQKIASQLLSDKITETYKISVCETKNCSCGGVDFSSLPADSSASLIEVFYKKGVTDTTAESVVKAVKDLGIKTEIKAAAGHKYYVYGRLSGNVLNNIATKLLANTLIQEYNIRRIDA